jgi:hypothetical protein
LWFDEIESCSIDVQVVASNIPKLAKGPEIDLRDVHSLKCNSYNFGRRPMQSGRLQKLFLDKSKSLSEDKLLKSTGNQSSDKLRPERLSFVKERNPEMKGGRKHAGFKLFGDINDERSGNQDFEDDSLRSDNDAISRFFKPPKEKGNCLIAVLSASSSVKAIIFPI